MKRFFLRIWLVAFVFFVLAQALIWNYYMYSYSDSEEIDDYNTKMFLSSFRHAGEEYVHKGVSTQELAARLGCPVETVELALLPDDVIQACQSDGGTCFRRDGEYCVVPLPNSSQAIQFGPLFDLSFGAEDFFIDVVAAVSFLILTAGGFWFVIRPTALELRSLEDAAGRITSGDWSIRASEKLGTPTYTLACAFNRMAEKTTSVISSQRDLLRAVSHELRTPIARLQAAMHIMAIQNDSQQRKERLSQLDDEFADLSRLVDELLTYSSLEGGSDPMESESEFDAIAELDDVLSERKDALASVGVSLIANYAAQPQRVSGSARQFRRALTNLVDNATRYARASVEISAEIHQGEFQLMVDDDGPGIPDADRERIFEPFVRLGRTDDDRGYGMGLAIVSRVVERYGGRVQILASPKGGCRMHLTWPVAVRAATNRR